MGRAGAGSGDRCAPPQRIQPSVLVIGLELHTRGHTFLAAAQRQPTWVTRVHDKPGPGPGIPFCPHSCVSCLLLVNPGGSVSPPSSPKGYSHTTGPQGREVNVPGGRGQCSLPGAMPGFLALKPRNTTHNTCGGILQAGYLAGDLTHPESSPEPTFESSSLYQFSALYRPERTGCVS